MSLFAESLRDDEGWGAGADGFAESTFASMPSIPTKSDNKLESSGLNASGFFNSEDSDASDSVSPKIIQSEKYAYRNFCVLGRGAFATCFLSQRSDNLYVCVKSLDNKLGHRQQEEREKIFSEIQALKAVAAHENITHLYEYFESQDHVLHICIEYCCGNTLADLIQENVTEKKKIV